MGQIRFAFHMDPQGARRTRAGCRDAGEGVDVVVKIGEAEDLGQDPGNRNEEEGELKKYSLVTPW